MKKKINVCLIQPAMYIHTMALLEVAIYLADLARRCGVETEINKNRFVHDALNIVVGAHLLPEGVFPPPGSVIFNSEQLGNKDAWFKTSHYIDILKRYTVWDYSRENLGAIPHDHHGIVPFLYCERLRQIERTAFTHDLVFYGSINDRRKAILGQLDWLGERKDVIFGLYGPERDARLAGARAVLNVHYYETQILEQVRCFYALSNGIPVITEDYPEHSAPAAYREALFVVPAGKPVGDYVKELSADGWAAFERMAQEKLAYFRGLDAQPEFAAVLDQALAWAEPVQAPPPLPRKLNLGCGMDYRQGYLNVDINPVVGPDAVLDLSARVEFPLRAQTSAFGELALDEGMLDEIVATDVLGHVPSLTTLMENCLRLLKVGGVFKISVPYDLSLGAAQDPTLLRAFNQNSWLLYTDWSWQLGWLAHRFELANRNVNLSELGKALLQRGAQIGDLLNTPRAVDSMQVELVKRATTPEERQLVRAFDDRFCVKLEV